MLFQSSYRFSPIYVIIYRMGINRVCHGSVAAHEPRPKRNVGRSRRAVKPGGALRDLLIVQ